MSISINPEIDARETNVITPHTDVNGSQVSYVPYPATSWSQNNATFTIVPPSMDTYLNRAIRKRYQIRVVYTGTTTSGTGLLLDVGRDALRSLADLRMTTNEVISFNGSAYPVSQTYLIYPDILEHYSSMWRDKHPLGAPDMYQVYSDGFGALNNPLTTYTNSESFEAGMKRGSISVVSITRSNTSVDVVYNLDSWFYIPQLLGPELADEVGLIRQRQINITTTFDFNPAKVVSHATGGDVAAFSSVVATLNAQPRAICKFISVPKEMIPVEPILKYAHQKMDVFTNVGGSQVAPNGTGMIVSNNIQLQRVPRFAFFYVREGDAQKTINSTDTFASIEQGTGINFNNQGNLLSTAEPEDWWRMSQACGLKDSLQAFKGIAMGSAFTNIGTCGSLVAFEFGRHLSLGQSDLGINSQGSFNFQMNVNFKNVNQTAAMVNPTLYIIIVYDQIMTIDQTGQCNFELPVQVSGSTGSGPLVELPYQSHWTGGSLSDMMGKVAAFAKKNKLVSRGLDAISGPVGMIPYGGPIASAAAKVGSKVADALGYGGAEMSRSAMRQAIQSL